ncbi:Myb-like dna-binding protein, partial [Globisporangium polare]
IIRSKSSSSVPSQASFLPPRSRKSYTRILADAAMKLEPLCLLDSVNQTFHVDVLLTGLEPFPFTDVSCEELFKQDGRYQQDLQEFANVCPTTTTTSPRDYCSYYLDATMAF